MRLDFRTQTNLQPTAIDNGMFVLKVMRMESMTNLAVLVKSPTMVLGNKLSLEMDTVWSLRVKSVNPP
ncbi:hypothetical protein CMK22_10955 [Candidatus Poribacteria bacterium]|nr:hypothetical protein [Candidatus Poribacteria bacterium]